MPSGRTGEQELIDRLKAKDEAALDLFMAEYGGKVYGLSLRLTSNHHDAEEVCQDVFLAVFEKIGAFRGEAKLSSWVYRITANAALMKLRRRSKVNTLPLEEELGPGMTEDGMIAEPVLDWTHVPSDELERKELMGCLSRAVEQLPPEYRAAQVHLADCPGCLAFINTYQQTIDLSKGLRSEDMPPELRQKLRSFIKGQAARRRPSFLDRVWSRLTSCWAAV